MVYGAEQIPLRDAAAVIAAIDHTAHSNRPVDERLEYLLKKMQELSGRETLCAIALFNDTGDNPLSDPIARYRVGEISQRSAAANYRTPAAAHAAYKITRPLVDQARQNPGTTVQAVLGPMLGEASWRQTELYTDFLEPMGCSDVAYCFSATVMGRVVGSGMYHQTGTPPLTARDVQVLSLIHRATVPIVDREVFEKRDLSHPHKFTARQEEVLLLLLTGDSEQQIAKRLYRSVHTVHTYVKQIYEIFGVNSRGELMARFIDKRLLKKAVPPNHGD